MKIDLPLEIWTELFGFVPQSQLEQLIPHIGDGEKKPKRKKRGHRRKLTILGIINLQKRKRKERECKRIGDRQFVSYVQFFLHKFGEVTLGELNIKWPRDENGPLAFFNGDVQMPWSENGPAEIIVNGKHRAPLADISIPENVKNFESIRLSYYDKSIIDFLQKFQQNSLLTNLNLSFYGCSDWDIVFKFLPLITSTNSIAVMNNSSDLLDELQNEYAEHAIPMLTSARILIAVYNSNDGWFSDWLHIPREDGKPRILFLHGYNRGECLSSLSQFIKHIKKDFLEAKQAVCFFIQLENFCDAANVQSLTMENGITQEELVIKPANDNYKFMTILRYPMGTTVEWIEEMSHYHTIHKRRIEFCEY